MKNDWKSIKWLYGELPSLVSEGVLGQDAADSLRKRYGEPPQKDSSTLALTVFTIIGALMVGTGLIMIVGHNWDQLGRLARTMIALAPLSLGLCGLVWLHVRKETRQYILESVCAFQTLALGAAFAIVGQTYNVGGDLPSLLFVWLIAAIPMAYLFNSVMAAALCSGIAAWLACISAGWENWQTWIAFAAILPYVGDTLVKKRGSGRTAFLGWCAGLALAHSFMASFPMAGIWEFSMPAAFSMLFLAGTLPEGDRLPAWRNPLRTIGAIGAGVSTLVLSIDKWSVPLIWNEKFPLSCLLAYLLVAACLAGLLFLAARRRWWDMPFGAVGVLAFALCEFASLHPTGEFLKLLFNPIVLCLGVLTIVSGIRFQSFGSLNGGLLLIAAWMLTKYLDDDLSLLFKGMLFIIIGVAFIAANISLVYRRRKALKKEVAA
jgi:uncharacterized membrane protein